LDLHQPNHPHRIGGFKQNLQVVCSDENNHCLAGFFDFVTIPWAAQAEPTGGGHFTRATLAPVGKPCAGPQRRRTAARSV
jgi:hypothetical protein